MQKNSKSSVSNSKVPSIRMNIREMFSSSANNMINLKCIITTAMLIALKIGLELVGSIQFSTALRVSTSFIALGVIGLLYGPVVGMFAGGISDVLAVILYPRGAYFFGFTIAAMIAGLIFGIGLYHKRAYPLPNEKPQAAKPWLSTFLLNKNGTGFLRTLATKGAVSLIANVILNTICIHITVGTLYEVLIPERLIKNAALLLPEAIVLYLIIRALETQPRLFLPQKK